MLKFCIEQDDGDHSSRKPGVSGNLTAVVAQYA